MADNLVDTGSTPFFPFGPNFKSSVSVSIQPAASLIEFPGTIGEVESDSDKRGVTLRGKYLLQDISDIYQMIDFFTDKLGRRDRFWLYGPTDEFTIYANALQTLTQIEFYSNGYQDVYTTNDRFYIRMPDGDIITRKVNSVSYNDVSDTITVSFSTGLDRDVLLSNEVMFGRLYLVRHDVDTLSLRFHTNSVAELSLRFFELVREYSLV